MVWTMRRMLSAVGPNEGIELLMQRLGKTKNNAEFLVSLSKSVEASERAEPASARPCGMLEPMRLWRRLAAAPGGPADRRL